MADSPFGPPPLPDKSEPIPGGAQVYDPSRSSQGQLSSFNSSDGPSFSDLLDVLNPLQHIPVINTLYREISGDTEGGVAELVGGALWGGFIGAGAALVNMALEDGTGKSIGEHVVALFQDDPKTDGATAIAAAGQKGDSTAAAAVVEAPVLAAATAGAPATLAASDDTAADSPMRAGDYLIFGGSRGAVTAPAPAAPAAPVASATTAAVSGLASRKAGGQTAARLHPSSATTAVASGTLAAPLTQMAAADSEPTRQGDYLVFGSGSPTSLTPPPAATPPEAATGASGSLGTVAASQLDAQGNAAFHAVPARSASITPRHSLPPPTTGPGAVPGSRVAGQPVATATTASASAASVTPDTASPGAANNLSWFAAAFNAGMDKYQKAAALAADSSKAGGQSATAVSGVATPGGGADASLN